MTSNLKRTLGGMLTLAVVLSAAEARAQSLEKPGAPPSEAAAPTAASSGPASFGDGGQFALSAERLFGFTYAHQTYGNSPAITGTAYTLLAAPLGEASGGYSWPRVGFDYFVARSFSAGGSVSFFRGSSGTTAQTGYSIAPRLGFGTMVGPWLGVWGRAGVTYTRQTSAFSYLGLTLEPTAAIVVSPHFALTLGPTLDLGLSGTIKAASGANESAKVTAIGVYFGFVILL